MTKLGKLAEYLKTEIHAAEERERKRILHDDYAEGRLYGLIDALEKLEELLKED